MEKWVGECEWCGRISQHIHFKRRDGDGNAVDTAMPVPISHSHTRTYISKKPHVQLMKPKLNYGNRNQIGIRYIPSVDFGSLVLERFPFPSLRLPHSIYEYMWMWKYTWTHTVLRAPHIAHIDISRITKENYRDIDFRFWRLGKHTSHLYLYTYRL